MSILSDYQSNPGITTGFQWFSQVEEAELG
jgi:hypothetical protein